MKKKIIALILGIIIALGCTPLMACNNGEEGTKPLEPETTKYQVVKRELPVKEKYEIGDKRWVQKPTNPTSNVIEHLDLKKADNMDAFLASVIQGIVNRETPSIYLTGPGRCEIPAGIDRASDWLKIINELYPDMEVEEIPSVYDLLVKYKEKIKGYVLYEKRIASGPMTATVNFSKRYGDLAVMNLTLMMCSAYDAIPLTFAQVEKLKNEYNIELPQVGDTIQFMLKNEDKTLNDDKANLDVWANCYKYAMAELSPLLSKEVMFHNIGLSTGVFDLAVATKAFCYNRVAKGATEETDALEQDILRMTKPNTPVFGLFYVGNEGDEHNFVTILTRAGKSLQALADVYNISWSNGLPYETMLREEQIGKKITLDENKNYVCISHTEGDNSLYTWNSQLERMNDKGLGETPYNWVMNPTLCEMIPYMTKYYKSKTAAFDGMVMPEMGLGYVIENPPANTMQGHYAWADEYLKREHIDSIRQLRQNVKNILPYAENMENLNSMLVGYNNDTVNKINNNNESAFLYKDTVYFQNFEGKSMDWKSLASFANGTPGFYSVTMLGWDVKANAINEIRKSGDDRFEFVTATQLADLYKQYYAKEFKDITSMNFAAGMTRREMGNLYYASNHNTVDELNKIRSADGENYFVYKFDINDEATKGMINLNIAGNYQIEISNDNLYWSIVAKADEAKDEPSNVCVDLTDFISKGKEIYVRIGDKTTNDDQGAKLFYVDLTTDKAINYTTKINMNRDLAYLADTKDSVIDENGRKGTFVYELNLNEKNQFFAVRGEGDIKARISADNKTFTDLVGVKYGGTNYFALKENVGKVYIELSSEDYITSAKLTLSTKKVDTVLFSPVGNNFDNMHSLGCDDVTLNTENALSSHLILESGNELVYRFNLKEGITEAMLAFRIVGTYNIALSSDNVNYTTIKSVELGEELKERVEYNVSDLINGKDEIYLKIGVNGKGRKIWLYEIQLKTNLSPKWMEERYEKMRIADFNISYPFYAKEELTPVGKLEQQLIDKSLCHGFILDKDGNLDVSQINYYDAKRIIRLTPDPKKETYVTYKFDFNKTEENIKFWAQYGLDLNEVDINKFRVDLRFMHNLLAQASGDGKEFVDIYDENDKFAAGGNNLKTITLKLDKFIGEDKVVYLRLKNSPSSEQGTTHDLLIEALKFFYN